MATRSGLVALLIATTSFAPAAAGAVDERPRQRELAGHYFFPSIVITDPFLSTFANVTAGAGYAWIDGFGFDIRGNPVGSASYNAAAILETVSFQATVTRWLALRIMGGGGIASGVNGRSALVIGALPPLSVGVGGTASWQLGQRTRIGATLDFQYSRFWPIQPLEAVRTSIETGEVNTARLGSKVDGYSLLPGAAIAYVPYPALGLLASAQYLWNEYRSTESDRSLSYVIIGGSAQMDLRLLSGETPLGFQMGYRVQIPFQSSARYVHLLEGGLFYTGRREVDLGLDMQIRWFDLRPDTRRPLDTTELLGLFVIRYYWN